MGKIIGVFVFVFLVMCAVCTALLGSYGAMVIGTAIGVTWTVRLVVAIGVSLVITSWLT